jgi:Ulp1 family protease
MKSSKVKEENTSRLCSIFNDIEILLIPINYKEFHWFLLILDFKAKHFLYFDSAAAAVGGAGRAGVREVRFLCIV